jgi:hypothetical protein
MIRFILISFLFSSFIAGELKAQKITPDNLHRFYSLDLLPEKWQMNSKILQTIDEIVPNAFNQLKNSRSCKNCNAGYYIEIKIDTVYILYGAMEYNSKSHADRSSRNVNTTWFKFRSYLSVIDFKGNEVSRLIITDPDSKETYRVNATEDVHRTGCSAPVKFVGSPYSASLDTLRYVIVPTDREILDITAHKLKKIKRIMKSWETYNIPPPSDNLTAPTNMATIQMIVAPLLFPMIAITSEKIAIGIPNQFTQPSKGKKAISVITKDITANSLAICFIPKIKVSIQDA